MIWVVGVHCYNCHAGGETLSRGVLSWDNPNASKSRLVVKPTVEQKAREIFGVSSINITIDGRRYHGGYIASESARGKYAEELVSS